MSRDPNVWPDEAPAAPAADESVWYVLVDSRLTSTASLLENAEGVDISSDDIENLMTSFDRGLRQHVSVKCAWLPAVH